MKESSGSPPAVVRPAEDLATLAERINAAHARAEAAVRVGLAHAREAGALLLLAKAKVPHGGRLPWLSKHCRCSERTAQVYMRVARRWPQLQAIGQVTADFTIDSSPKLLTDARPAADDEQQRQLVADGGPAPTGDSHAPRREMSDEEFDARPRRIEMEAASMCGAMLRRFADAMLAAGLPEQEAALRDLVAAVDPWCNLIGSAPLPKFVAVADKALPLLERRIDRTRPGQVRKAAALLREWLTAEVPGHADAPAR
jgi:hypothetical protein